MKEKDKYQVSLKMILRNALGEILAMKAVDTGSFAGYYDLPGGRIDTDEFSTPLADILAREIAEEIGDVRYNLHPIPVAVGRHEILPQHTRSGVGARVLYLFYEAEYLGGDVQSSDEHLGYRWLNLSELQLRDFFTSGLLEGMVMYLEGERQV